MFLWLGPAKRALLFGTIFGPRCLGPCVQAMTFVRWANMLELHSHSSPNANWWTSRESRQHGCHALASNPWNQPHKASEAASIWLNFCKGCIRHSQQSRCLRCKPCRLSRLLGPVLMLDWPSSRRICCNHRHF